MDAEPDFVDLGVLPCTLDHGIASRAAIGLLVLATDQTMEHEFRQLIRLPGVATYAARLFNDADITPETLRAMRDRIAPAAELILPSLHLDVVAFGCTSASMALARRKYSVKFTARGLASLVQPLSPRRLLLSKHSVRGASVC